MCTMAGTDYIIREAVVDDCDELDRLIKVRSVILNLLVHNIMNLEAHETGRRQVVPQARKGGGSRPGREMGSIIALGLN